MRKFFLTLFIAAATLVSLAATIYPTPQQVVWGSGTVKFNEKLIKVKTDTSLTAEGYVLDISKKGVLITSADARGAFYARQTLNQLIDNGSLPIVKVTDYPTIRFRGVVEGFYGKPWSHRDRLAQFVFYGQNKLNTYIYGPKDDPYHSSLSGHADGTSKDAPGGWRVPYPAEQAAQITELTKVAKENYVDFVWAIHPGADIKWTGEDAQNLINKFNAMYDLGVRSYAVFFDDISGDGTNPSRQAELLNRINREFVRVKGDVTPLIMCPTEYNKSWANPNMEKGYLAVLGRELDKDIQVMWTGDSVCADITTQTLDWINARIKREAYIWWNFPVTDYVRHLVVQGPAYGLTKEAKGRMSGFMSNPMENAEASKIALFGVADYTWNPEKYDYLAAWQEGIKRIMPQAAAAYRTFAIHSADLEKNGHGYRRDESWETNVADLAKLKQDFYDLSLVNKTISNSDADQFLVAELKPWLIQAEVVGQTGLATLELVHQATQGGAKSMWQAYLESELSTEAQKAYNAHKVGTLKLMPWIVDTRDSVARTLYNLLGGSLSGVTNPKAKIYTNVARLAAQTVSDVANIVQIAPVLEQFSVEPQGYLGVEFPAPITLVKIDASLAGGGRLKRQYSLDGQNWTDKASVARFVRYFNPTDKAQSVRLEKFAMQVMPDVKSLAAMTDGDLKSAYELDDVMEIEVPDGAIAVTVLGEKGAKADTDALSVDVPLMFLQSEIPSGSTVIRITNASGKIREIIWKIEK